MSKVGRIVIPLSVREQLSLSEGVQLEMIVQNNVIELHNPRLKVDKLLSAFSQRLKSHDHSLVEDLIKERRNESEREKN